MNAVVKIFAISSLVALISTSAIAAETIQEKKEAVTNDVKRDAKKSINRVEEAACMEGDVKCAGQKAKNRIEEAGDATKDKTKELKNKVD